ncbi:MAG TPA: hypothetical protein VJV78_07680 [Polyangiales bacterium]|nr:hypothetical protein [Polyangiales bacterium]
MSGALHLAWAFSLRELKIEPARLETNVEFTLVTQPSPAPPEPEPSAPPPPTAAAPREPELPRPRQARRAPIKAAAPEQPVEAEQVAVAEAPAPAVASQPAPELPAPSAPQPRAAPDLSPRRAAVASYESLSNLPRTCNPPAANGGACQPPPPRDELAQDRLNQSLRQSARSLAHLAPRDPPVLHREADGGYRFNGHVFTAKIEPDGQVRFADDSVASLQGPATNGPGVGAKFDLTDAIQRAMGDESYSAEKRWFLEQTAELREQLSSAARAKERAAGRRYLERELEGILLAHELDPAQKRARVFEVWQDCGDDADSADTRRLVEVFVRARMPEGSELGFSPAELARLNAARRGLRQFDPYRVPVAGAPG